MVLSLFFSLLHYCPPFVKNLLKVNAYLTKLGNNFKFWISHGWKCWKIQSIKRVWWLITMLNKDESANVLNNCCLPIFMTHPLVLLFSLPPFGSSNISAFLASFNAANMRGHFLSPTKIQAHCRDLQHNQTNMK